MDLQTAVIPATALLITAPTTEATMTAQTTAPTTEAMMTAQTTAPMMEVMMTAVNIKK